jgi:hypothetical protein
METVRGLLTPGNGKTGRYVAIWSLPAVLSCPGRSVNTCERFCYARQSRFLLPAVIDRLHWNYDQALLPSFPARMIREVRRKGVVVCRIHGSGDFMSASYAEAWVKVIKACPNTVFYCYTHSHVVPDIRSVLVRMARLKNARVWFSYDRDIPVPESLPPRVRSCYLMVEEGEALPKVDLVFRIRRLRKERIPLAMTCPSESPKGRGEVVCGSCGKCFRQ